MVTGTLAAEAAARAASGLHSSSTCHERDLQDMAEVLATPDLMARLAQQLHAGLRIKVIR